MDDTRVDLMLGSKSSQVKYRNFGRTMYTDYAYKISFPGRKRDSARSKRCEMSSGKRNSTVRVKCCTAKVFSVTC